jgi:hypothetical protein
MEREAMNNELLEFLIVYNKITLELIHSVEKENYDILDELFQNRQTTINSINNLSYSKDMFTSICENIGIVENEKKLNEIMNIKRQAAREELGKMSGRRTAHKSYNKNFNVDSLFFNKKI